MTIKIFSILTMLFLALTAISQDWTSVKTNAITYFSKDSTNIHPIRIDSISIHNDTTTIRSFHMIRANSENNFYNSLYGASWIGDKVYFLQNGQNIFFNKNQRPITIRTLAIQNETWILYSHIDSSYIEAKISLTDTMRILGVLDSVKFINLQWKDKFGNPINSNIQNDTISIINTNNLILSKSFGLVQIMDFYMFPTNSSDEPIDYMYGNDFVYKLIGISNPALGYQNLTTKEIFDYNVGDELHTLEIQYLCDYCTYAYSLQKIEKYLSKIVSLNEDTIHYQVETCSYRSTYNNGVIDSISLHDTINYNIILSSQENHIYNTLPLEPLNNGLYMFTYANTYKKTWSDFYVFSLTSDSSHLINTQVDPSYERNFYRGLSGPYYHYNGMMGDENMRDIVYSKKGIIEWGTPWNCSILLKDQFLNESSKIEYLIYPNPVSHYLNVYAENSNKKSYLILEDVNGKFVFTSEFQQSTIVDISKYSKGFFILRIFGENKIESHKIVVE